jgi:hypothetical protein
MPVLGRAFALRWLTDRCTVETPSGTGLAADWGTPVEDVACRVIDQAGQLKLGPTGIEALQGTQVVFAPEDLPAIGARLTLTNGRQLQVDAASLSTDAPLPSVTTSEVKRR